MSKIKAGALLCAALSIMLVGGWAASASASPASVSVPKGVFDARGMTQAQAVEQLRSILINSSSTAGAVQPLDSRAGNDLPSAPNCDQDQNSLIGGYFYAFRGYQQVWTSNGHAPYEVNWYAVKVPIYPYGLVNVGPSTHAPCYNTW